MTVRQARQVPRSRFLTQGMRHSLLDARQGMHVAAVRRKLVRVATLKALVEKSERPRPGSSQLPPSADQGEYQAGATRTTGTTLACCAGRGSCSSTQLLLADGNELGDSKKKKVSTPKFKKICKTRQFKRGSRVHATGALLPPPSACQPFATRRPLVIARVSASVALSRRSFGHFFGRCVCVFAIAHGARGSVSTASAHGPSTAEAASSVPLESR